MPKTRNAFALERFEHVDLLAAFRASYEVAKKKELRRLLCLEEIFRLTQFKEKVIKHTKRLDRYSENVIDKVLISVAGSSLDELKIYSSRIKRLKALTDFYSRLIKRIKIAHYEVDAMKAGIKNQDFVMAFAERLKTARQAAGLTQAELAEKIGVKRSTYGQFEQGRNEPNVSTLPALARELNISVEWLLGMKN